MLGGEDIVSGGTFSSHPGAGLWAVEARLKCMWHIVAPQNMYIGKE